MKTWSPDWKASKQPRKQRKYRFQAPLNIKRKFVSSHLSKELRVKHSTRSLGLRTGDTVKIMRGQFKGKTGKIEEVDLSKCKARIAGITLQRKDGNRAMVWFQPSNLLIIELKMDDKKRQAILERRK
ncbi:MAG: 50S ribosomal protein L24 [Nanoarchaeota archaeon]|nr:50S ribosomal protein L24 [Nanoarchaeota archaeon]